MGGRAGGRADGRVGGWVGGWNRLFMEKRNLAASTAFFSLPPSPPPSPPSLLQLLKLRCRGFGEVLTETSVEARRSALAAGKVRRSRAVIVFPKKRHAVFLFFVFFNWLPGKVFRREGHHQSGMSMTPSSPPCPPVSSPPPLFPPPPCPPSEAAAPARGAAGHGGRAFHRRGRAAAGPLALPGRGRHAGGGGRQRRAVPLPHVGPLRGGRGFISLLCFGS